MKHKQTAMQLWLFVGLVVIILMGCREGELPVPTPETAVPVAPTASVAAPTATVEIAETAVSPSQPTVLMSELLPGAPGNNNYEFIELYNTGLDPINLNGWSLWYRLNNNQEAQLVYEWGNFSEIPGLGHYLLLRAGQTYELFADAHYDVPLFERRGGLILQDANGEVVDRLGWGTDAADDYFAGEPAPAPTDGGSLERLPGGQDGNGVNSLSNAADFVVRGEPDPQNSGSLPAPLPEDRLSLAIEMPTVVEPGAEFDVTVMVTNESREAASTVEVSMPQLAAFTVLSEPDGAVVANGRVAWTIPNLPAGETAAGTFTLQSPFTYVDTVVTGVKAAAPNLPAAFAPPQLISVAGGSVPIAAARTLTGNVVTVEGIATMYTGGFFAGSTGTKFYLEDETGGVQVYVPGGNGVVNVNIGERVRVTGGIEIYRDAVELVPEDIEVDVEVVGSGDAPTPSNITASDNETNDAILGMLTQLEGTATRIEEFSFSYEMDMMDAAGNTTLVYIEKDTGMTAEPFEVGKLYRVTGISEFYSGQRQLKPRLQTDIREIFPPVLLLAVSGPNSAVPGDVVTYEMTAVNHTSDPLTNLEIRAALPQGDGTIATIGNEGVQSDNRLVWQVAELPGEGAAVTVSYAVQINENAVQPVIAGSATAVADQWPDPVTTNPFRTFVGASGVPIWAIQGEGERSPYLLSDATTQGVVTAVFPELSGFWLQETESDDNPATSAGLFVLVDQFDIPVAAGERVQVTGRIREIAGQTALYPTAPEQITLLEAENELPQPVAYDPPADSGAALLYNESLEGMLVQIAEPALVVAPTTQYGEYALVNPKWGVDTVARTEDVGYLIYVDDGSSVRHADQTTLPYAVAKGNLVEGISGPLAYTFGHYKIEPSAVPQVYGEGQVPPMLPEVGDNQISIATFNVENLFDTRDPHPSSPERPSRAVYAARLTKLANTIQAMGAPTIIGLQEVENIGVLEDLLELDMMAPYSYEPYLIEGFDSRGIDVAYLVRSDRVTVEMVTNEGAPAELFSRPPLLLKAIVEVADDSQTIYLLNNHFLSLSGGEEATEPVRTAQAAWNADLAQQIAADDPEAHLVVLGDLNSFYQTLPIETLQESELRHVYEWVASAGPLPYTYIFEGRTQTLDHILVSEALFGQLSDVQALHVNADYPMAMPEDTTVWRLSDHDPLVAVFTWE